MPLQNRVDPFGLLHVSRTRGLFTGNRGVLHDPDTRTLTGRRWTTRAWIICSCDWKDRRRDVWGRNGTSGGVGWSELFFLDEVTALAAGHRPCFFCRRGDAKAFQAAFASGNALAAMTAPQMDMRLHAERRLSARTAPVAVAPDDPLPDGTMIDIDGQPNARRNGQWLQWSLGGYGASQRIGAAHLITPPSTVAALRAGFKPVWADDRAAERPSR